MWVQVCPPREWTGLGLYPQGQEGSGRGGGQRKLRGRGPFAVWKRPELDTEKVLERALREQEHLHQAVGVRQPPGPSCSRPHWALTGDGKLHVHLEHGDTLDGSSRRATGCCSEDSRRDTPHSRCTDAGAEPGLPLPTRHPSPSPEHPPGPQTAHCSGLKNGAQKACPRPRPQNP